MKIGDTVVTIDGHIGKIIKIFIATYWGEMCFIQENNGLIYRCPIRQVVLL